MKPPPVRRFRGAHPHLLRSIEFLLFRQKFVRGTLDFERSYNTQSKTVVADAGYGSEQNYEMMEDKGIEAYVRYKTAKRRFAMEIRNLIISMIVVQCGGDPSRFFKKQKE